MSKTIAVERFTGGLFYVFEEAFEQVHGVFLDKGTSLFETLATISAEEASRPVGNQCATLAAQVAHIRFYIDLTEKYMLGDPQKGADWDEIWRTVGSVTSEEWNSIRTHRILFLGAQCVHGLLPYRLNYGSPYPVPVRKRFRDYFSKREPTGSRFYAGHRLHLQHPKSGT